MVYDACYCIVCFIAISLPKSEHSDITLSSPRRVYSVRRIPVLSLSLWQAHLVFCFSLYFFAECCLISFLSFLLNTSLSSSHALLLSSFHLFSVFFLPSFASIGCNQLWELSTGEVLNKADITSDWRPATLYKRTSLRIGRLRLKNRLRDRLLKQTRIRFRREDIASTCEALRNWNWHKRGSGAQRRRRDAEAVSELSEEICFNVHIKYEEKKRAEKCKSWSLCCVCCAPVSIWANILVHTEAKGWLQ